VAAADVGYTRPKQVERLEVCQLREAGDATVGDEPRVEVERRQRRQRRQRGHAKVTDACVPAGTLRPKP
jgi:hypothetical protein